MFNINYDNIIELLLPVRLRQRRTRDYLKAVLKPLKSLFNSFSAYRLYVIDRITHTGQIMYLEHYLNNLYSPQGQGIFIEDAITTNMVKYLYNENEGEEPLWLYNENEGETPVWLYNDAEIDDHTDFIVHVPNHLSVTSQEIKNVIEIYRPAGKRYQVLFYEQNPPL